MTSAAYLRARRLATEGLGAANGARVFGVLHALLLLAVVGTAGGLIALATSHGDATIPQNRPAWLPRWVLKGVPAHPTAEVIQHGTGLYPVATANRQSTHPAHRLVGRVVERAVSTVPTLRNNEGAALSLIILGLVLVLATLWTSQARSARAAQAAGEAASALRRQIHRQHYRLGQSALPSQGMGPVVTMFARDVEEIGEGVHADLERSWGSPVLAIGLVSIALAVSWPLTLMVLSLASLVGIASRPLNRRARQVAEVAHRDAEVYRDLLQEDLELMRTVRVYGMEAEDNRRFEDHLERLQHADSLKARWDARISPTTWLMAEVSAVLVAGLVASNVMDGRLSVAGALILLGSLALLAKPVRNWLAMRRQVRQAGRVAGPLFDYLELTPELQQAVGAQFLPPLRQRITFEDVSLDNPSGRPLLEGVTFTIPARSRTALMGRDEEAKHALACMIPRLLDPKSGRVRIDGVDLREVTLESARAQVGTVFQSDLAFSDTVIANIALGDPNQSLPKVIEAAKVAHAHNFIQDLPQGYDTPIGPLGRHLRPDELYRIALARAFLHDPAILIIEEPTTPIDDDTKQLIDDTIDRLAQDRTILFLPHRFSTIRGADQVLVLHNGRLEASGTPKDLQSASKVYRHLQYVEFNQFATGEVEAGELHA